MRRMNSTGRLTHLLRWQSTLLARQWRAGGAHRAAEGWLVAILLAARTPILLAQCRRIPEAIARGELTPALLIEMLTGGLLLSWLLVAATLGGARADGPGLAPRRLLRFPVTSRERAALSLAAFLSRPAAVVLLLQSVMVFWPLAGSPHPVPALVAWPLAVMAAIAAAWSLDIVVTRLGEGRRGIVAGLLSVGLLAAMVFLALPSELLRSGDRLSLATPLGRLLLDDGQGLGFIPTGRAALPSGWVRLAAIDGAWWPLLAAPLVSVGLFELTRRLFDGRLARPESPAGGRRATRPLRPFPGLPGPIGAIVAFDLRLQSRTPEWRVNLLLGLATTILVLFWDRVVWWLLPISLSVLFLSGVGQAANAFGLDGAGVERWFLAPVRGVDQVRGRNASFLLTALITMGPPFVAAFVRFGAGVTGPLLLASAGAVLALAAFGNLRSVAAPTIRRSSLFGSSADSGGVVALLGAVAAIGLPAFLGLLTARHTGAVRAGAQAAWLAATAMAWWASMPRAARRLDLRGEEFRREMLAP